MYLPVKKLALTLSVLIFLYAAAAIAHAQNENVRRITHTAPESININPALSGDGRTIVFESNADTGGQAGSGFRLLAATSSEPILLSELARSRAPSPAVSQDGTRIAFASRDDPLGTNPDGNSEIFTVTPSGLAQLTNTSPDDFSRRTLDGSFQPSISDDGLTVAFSSNRDLTGRNPDHSFEIFIFDSRLGELTQLTGTNASSSATDAKLSGDGARVAFILTDRPPAAKQTDSLVVFDRLSQTSQTIAAGVDGLTLAYGRAISDDGTRLVYTANTGANSSQVFLYDGRNGVVRQITSLGARAADVSLQPSISGDGTRIAFATRRGGIDAARADGSVELYVYDVPSNRFMRLTNAPPAASGEVVSSLDDAGTLVVFSFPRALFDATSTEFADNAEIFLAQLPARPPFDTGLRIFNGAAPASNTAAASNAVAPDSIATATGSNLSLSTIEAERLANNSFPERLGGVSVSVNGRVAQIFFVSPGQVNFHVPPATEIGEAVVIVRNHDGFETRGTINITPAAPGLFTQHTGGEVVALDGATLSCAPFDLLDAARDPRRLILFATGIRRASSVNVTIGGRSVKVEDVIASPELPGLDQVHIRLSTRLRSNVRATLLLHGDSSESNRAVLTLKDAGGQPRPASVRLTPSAATIPAGGEAQLKALVLDANDEEIAGAPVTFQTSAPGVATVDAGGLVTGRSAGVARVTVSAGAASASAELRVVARTLLVNEVLADPPDGAAGDANHDGVRSGAEDEFVELLNGTDSSLNISGWTIATRTLTGSTETTRHVFAGGSIIPAGDALVLFGGGSFHGDDPLFGGAQVVKASSGSLSLTNAGLTIVVRDAAGNLVTRFSYGTPEDNFGGDGVNESLTRSPDIEGAFVRHTTASTRRFSPGCKVDGSFFQTRVGRLAGVALEPSGATVFVGQTAQFTARAFDQFERPLPGVGFTFETSEPTVAALAEVTTGTNGASAVARYTATLQGRTHITVRATHEGRILTSAPATLIVNIAPPRVTRVEVAAADISTHMNRGGTRRLTATAFDEHERIVADARFSWSSSDDALASVSAGGLASGAGFGQAVITATTSDGRGGTISGQLTLSVDVPLLINEVLADVPADDSSTLEIEGDANHDGLRSSADDEFVELFNNTQETVDISGLVISDSASRRFTFPAHTTLGAGGSVVIFGGGTPPPNASLFGGALIFTASSLGLNDGGDTVTIKLPLRDREATVAAFSYGPGTETPAPVDQSLTRSPDAETGTQGGAFLSHRSSSGAAGRAYSPGTRADGIPFGSPTLARIEISPPSAVVPFDGAQLFHARAFALAGGAEVEVPNVCFIWQADDAGLAALASTLGSTTEARALSHGSTRVRARAGQIEATATLTIEPPPPVLTSVGLSPQHADIIVGATQNYSAQALDQFGRPLAGVVFTFDSSDARIAAVESFTVDSTTGTALGTVSGRAQGATQITATASSGGRTVTSDAALLNVADAPHVPAPGQIIVNEAVVSFSSGTPARNDFVELFNTTESTLDISGLRISFRPGGNAATPRVVTLDGTAGSGRVLIRPRSYFLIANGSTTFGVAADFGVEAGLFDLNNTAGAIKIEIGDVKLDGFAYRQSGSTLPAAFDSFGEGSVFVNTSTSANTDFLRSPNATDTNNNAADFRRNGTATSVTPKAANPTLP